MSGAPQHQTGYAQAAQLDAWLAKHGEFRSLAGHFHRLHQRQYRDTLAFGGLAVRTLRRYSRELNPAKLAALLTKITGQKYSRETINNYRDAYRMYRLTRSKPCLLHSKPDFVATRSNRFTLVTVIQSSTMLTLDLSNMLWSTRGKEWGFRFLHVPSDRTLPWDEVYSKVFGSSDDHARYRHGSIHMPQCRSTAYIAVRLFDPEQDWRDSAGRAIPHELLFVVDPESMDRAIRVDWPRVVLAHLRPWYHKAYNGRPEAIANDAFQGLIAIPETASRPPARSENTDITLRSLRGIGDGSSDASEPLHSRLWRVLNTDVADLLRRPQGK